MHIHTVMYVKGMQNEDDYNYNINTCKYCQANNVIKYGTQNGIQYFLCKNCKHKFATINTIPKMRYNTKDIGHALDMYYDGNSLNEIRNRFIQQDGNYISKATPYNWVQRFTTLARDEAGKYKPNISNVWVSIVQSANVNGEIVKLWNLIDTRTRFLISPHLSKQRTYAETMTLIEKTTNFTETYPEIILTHFEEQDQNYLAELRQQNLQIKIVDNIDLVERYRLISATKIKILNNLKSMEAAKRFLDGWAIHYNFFSNNIALEGKTPAEAADIRFPYKSWQELIEQPYYVTARIRINIMNNL